MKMMLVRNFLLSSAALVSIAGSAFAQPEGAASVESVTVTGSRIERAGYEAPTPVTVTTAEILDASNPSGPGDALKQMPILASSVSARGSTGSAGSGGTFLNLRNLGANNTLVLVDGERFVGANSNGTVDISMIPTALIQRVDIVTGGASAAYGSDAVTGVVNFILDKEFTGLKGSLAAGVSTFGQNGEVKGTFAAGTTFGAGRGHAMMAAEYYDDKGVYSLIDTVNGQRSCQTISLPKGSATTQGYACNVTSSQANFTGIISGPAKLAGTTFDNNGNPIPFNYGTLVTSTTMVGGDGIKPEFLPGQEPLKRGVFYGRVSWDFSDSLSAYLTVDEALVRPHYQIGSYDLNLGSTAITINSDNAYLAPSLKATMLANNIPSFSLNKYFANLPRTWIENDSNTLRIVAGLQGKVFGDWTWNAHAESGHVDNIDNVFNTEDLPHMAMAADAVVNPANGQIVCRTTLTNPTNGCIPFNAISNGGLQAPAKGQGVQGVSDAQLNYLTGLDWRRTMIIEDDVAFNIAGNPFSDWAGPISLAAGGEWRYESMRQSAEPHGADFNFVTGVNGPYRNSNFLPQSGNFSVAEGYVETVVPLLRDLSFAKQMDFNGAIRLTNYTTSGDAVTWKAGITWDVVDDLRLRATRSRDIRAPNLQELYAAQTSGHNSIIDYGTAGNPVNAQAQTYTQGNPNLTPEKSDTTTLGVVYQSSWLPGLQASADAYRIDIADAIASPDFQRIVLQCSQGSTAECAFVLRNPNGSLLGTLVTPQNLQSINTEGVDFEASYHFLLQDISELKGDMGLHGVATYVGKYAQVTQGIATVNYAGEDDFPQWRWTVQATYSNDPFSMFLQARYSGEGLFSKSLSAAILPPMHVGSQILVDLNLNYDVPVGRGVASLFFNVTDLFNDIPPPFADGGGQNLYGSGQFDTLGRYFRTGVRFNF